MSMDPPPKISSHSMDSDEEEKVLQTTNPQVEQRQSSSIPLNLITKEYQESKKAVLKQYDENNIFFWSKYENLNKVYIANIKGDQKFHLFEVMRFRKMSNISLDE